MGYRCVEIEFKVTEEPLRIAPSLPRQDGWEKTLARCAEGFVVSDGSSLAKIGVDGRLLWKQALPIDGFVREACISSDRVVVTTNLKSYGPWGSMGPAFMLDLIDGRVVKKLIADRIAALSNGCFLLGLSGYDCFDTWLYDRAGEKRQSWRSYGHYIIGDDDDIRVLELSGTKPSKASYVRLHRNGEVERGPHLKGVAYHRPVIFDDGVVVTLDGGDLYAYDKGLGAQRICAIFPYHEDKSHCYIVETISGDKNDLQIGLRERSLTCNDYQCSRWRLKLSRK